MSKAAGLVCKPLGENYVGSEKMVTSQAKLMERNDGFNA